MTQVIVWGILNGDKVYTNAFTIDVAFNNLFTIYMCVVGSQPESETPFV